MAENQKKQNFTLPIIVMFALYFMIAFVTNFAGSMGVIVQNQFGASNAMAQLGTLANFIAYACMGIPAGHLLKRKGYKFTSLAAVIVGFVGVGIQFLSGPLASFGVYVLGAFVAGFSMCMLNIVVNPMLNTLGGGGKRGNQLNMFGGTLNSLGGTIAPVLLGYLIGGQAATAQVADAAPAMIIAMAIFAVAFVVIVLTKIPEPHMETAEEKAARLSGKVAKDPVGPMSFRHFVLGAIAIFFYVGVENGIPNTANLFLSKEVGPDVAGTVISVYWFLMLVGRLLGSLVAGKVSSKAMLTTMSSVALAFVLCIILLPSTMVNMPIVDVAIPLNFLFVPLCGLCTSIMWGSIFNLAVEGLGALTALASGLFMMMVVGGGVLPLVQNAIADAAGYMTSYWVPVAGLAYICWFAVMGSKVRK